MEFNLLYSFYIILSYFFHDAEMARWVLVSVLAASEFRSPRLFPAMSHASSTDSYERVCPSVCLSLAVEIVWKVADD